MLLKKEKIPLGLVAIVGLFFVTSSASNHVIREFNRTEAEVRKLPFMKPSDFTLSEDNKYLFVACFYNKNGNQFQATEPIVTSLGNMVAAKLDAFERTQNVLENNYPNYKATVTRKKSVTSFTCMRNYLYAENDPQAAEVWRLTQTGATIFHYRQMLP